MPVFISYEIFLVFAVNDYFCSQLQQIKEEIYLVLEKWWLLQLSVLVFNKTGTAPPVSSKHCTAWKGHSLSDTEHTELRIPNA